MRIMPMALIVGRMLLPRNFDFPPSDRDTPAAVKGIATRKAHHENRGGWCGSPRLFSERSDI